MSISELFKVSDVQSSTQIRPAIKSTNADECVICKVADKSDTITCDSCGKIYHILCIPTLSESSVLQKEWQCGTCEALNLAKERDKPQTNTLVCNRCSKECTEDFKRCLKCKLCYHPDCFGAIDTAREFCLQCISAENINTIDLCDSKSKKPRSRASSRSQTKLIELELKQLEEEHQLEVQRLEEVNQKKKEFLEKKYSLLRTAQSSSSSASSLSYIEKQKNTKTWVENQQKSEVSPTGQPLNIEALEFVPAKHQEGNKVCVCQHKSKNHVAPIEPPRSLTKAQIEARRATKDLPLFYGDSRGWPLFISCFEHTTRECNYSNYENLMRLAHSLRGPAKTAVSSLLINPENLQDAIETLRELFGQPRQVIFALVEDVKAAKRVKLDDPQTLYALRTAVTNLVANIKASKLDSYLIDPYLIQEIIDKLPAELRYHWGSRVESDGFSNLINLNLWLQERTRILGHTLASIPFPVYDEKKLRQKGKDFVLVQSTKTSKRNSSGCVRCEGDCESLELCETFLKDALQKRWDFLKNNKMCFRCLAAHAKPWKCTETFVCPEEGCGRKHHKVLHDYGTQDTVATMHGEHQSVIFKILPVTLYGRKGSLSTFAFIDEGSSVTLIDESLSLELGLEGSKHPMCIYWTDKQQHTEDESRLIQMDISGVERESPRFTIRAHTMNSMKLPVQSISAELIKQHGHLTDLGIVPYKNGIPRILIGLDNSPLCIPLKIKEGYTGPSASKTRIGWVLQGNRHSQNIPSHLAMTNVHQCDCSLEKLMKFQYSIENFGAIQLDSSTQYSAEEMKAIEILEKSTVFKNGHYETGLLWKTENANIPDSYQMAVKRQMCLEKKLLKDPVLYNRMKMEMESYERKGYVRKLTVEETYASHSRKWYLPVFPVLNKNKPDKFRMVWDAAAEVGGVSLNHLLLKGPDLVPLLIGVLYRFREGRFGMCGDIAEMFHMVKIKPEDQHSQRFLWRSSVNEKLQTFCMQVMTFGACSSPTSAQYIKNFNARKFERNYPEAVQAILRDHYVDDFLGSEDSIPGAIKLCEDVTKIHAAGGFRIRNWISNCPGLLETLEPSSGSKNLEVNGATFEKILGMWWSTEDDGFSYKLRMDSCENLLLGEQKPTKRELLSILMRIFDPLGLLNHVLIFPKVLLQKVWRSGTSWDEKINDDLFVEWKKWLRILPMIEQVRCNRWYFEDKFGGDVDLHVFADASDEAYAVAIYFRFKVVDGYRCSLICSKSRVAPKSVVSIPRLELMAAVLAVRLTEVVKREHRVVVRNETFWSDSSCVLWWIKDDNKKYKPFVAARVCEIKEKSCAENWRYVPSKDNVADMATKWKRGVDFSSNSPWFTGPSFLHLPEESWPINILEQTEANEEVHLQVDLRFPTKLPFYVDDNRFSKWRKLVGATAYALRFINVMKDPSSRRGVTRSLSSDEMQAAESLLIRQCQYRCFKSFVNNTNESYTDDLVPGFSAFKDDKGIIRLQGRLDSAPHVTEDFKRPILLPFNDNITFLIMDDVHRRYFHIHQKTVQNEIVQKYFIPKLGTMMKKLKNKCQHCRNANSRPLPPQMGDLPSARLQSFTKAFTYSGIDYFGPVLVTVGRRTEKRYGVLITCLVTRAIHLEVSSALTTDSCIMSISRFTSRRGVPAEFYSDNGTNFKGAESELKMFFDAMDKEKLRSEFTTSYTKWSFNPPASPHMGGCWERMVRTVKSILYKLMQSFRTPSDELLLTMLSQIECVVNSRPLTTVPLSSEDEPALTPNHFIFGTSSGVLPKGEFTDEGVLLRKQWMIAEQFANAFWVRFIREYLPMIARRSKWHKKQEPLKEGDIVLIVDEKSPRNIYPKGRILQAEKGSNGQVRTVLVQTLDGVYKRPAVKIAKLDVLGVECCEEEPEDLLTGGDC